MTTVESTARRNHGARGRGGTPVQVSEVVANPTPARAPASRFGRWLLANRVSPVGPNAQEGQAHEQAWWKVMCLTGLDYFSSLAYVPGIAALAAGALSPLATLLIVGLTLIGMLPMYRRVAKESPHGQGSVAMLEGLLPFWRGKAVILGLLGFVVTSWIVTITLSAADASVHVSESPLFPAPLHGHDVAITIGMLVILGGVFLMGFSEAVAVAIPLVGMFLALNAAVIGTGLFKVATTPAVWHDWSRALTTHGAGFGAILGPSLLAFPLLVLGLSGFETGVSMMPLIKSGGDDQAARMASRIGNTKKLLTAASVIMSVYLLATSVVTATLIPASEFKAGGSANGRALAWLAHDLLGQGFGTIYDLSTIAILWFAGASAMAGLINIVPRYLPSYGMTPEWGRAVRPVVVVFTGMAIVLTIAFHADVNAQAGAYATGILSMMVSGALAVTISAARRRQRVAGVGFGALTAVLIYALGQNVHRHPDGLAISAVFIVAIVVTSLVSRVTRTLELRADRIEFDAVARRFIAESIQLDGELDIVAHKRQAGSGRDYAHKERTMRGVNPVPGQNDVLFLEIDIHDPSRFSDVLQVKGVQIGKHRVLRAASPAAPNAIAAVLLALRDATGVRPHAYFEWSEGSPLRHLTRYLFLGEGDTAPIVREIIRKVEPQPDKRPCVHVGG